VSAARLSLPGSVTKRPIKLVRAVNIVECTRLQNAVRHAGGTEGLLFHATVPLMVQNRSVGLINIATEQWEFLSPADLKFLSAAGSQVAIGLERARLYDLADTERIRLEQELEMARAVAERSFASPTPKYPWFHPRGGLASSARGCG